LRGLLLKGGRGMGGVEERRRGREGRGREREGPLVITPPDMKS